MGDDELRETKGERHYWWIACACTCILIVCPLRFWEPFWTSWNSAHFFLCLPRTFYCLHFCDISKLIKSSRGRAFTDYGLPHWNSGTWSLDYWPHFGFQKIWQVWCLVFTAFSVSVWYNRRTLDSGVSQRLACPRASFLTLPGFREVCLEVTCLSEFWVVGKEELSDSLWKLAAIHCFWRMFL